jgi:hypothetical protein
MFGVGCNIGTNSFGVLPDGTIPFIFSDFQNGIYQREGSDVPVTDLWEANPDFGSSFDPDVNILPGEGFRGLTSLTSSASLLLNLAAGLTIIFVANMAITSSGMKASADLMDAPDFNNEQIAEFFNFGGNVRARMKDYNGGVATTVNLPLADDHKFAALILPNALAISVEGSSVLEFTPTGVLPTLFGIQTESGALIRSVGLYPAQDKATLPALSL